MGRYYSGDIEGKFAFGVQSSYDPEYFGSEAVPNAYWACGCSSEITGKPAECGCELIHEHSADCPEDCNKKLDENVQNEDDYFLLFSFEESQINEIKEKLDNLLTSLKSDDGFNFLEYIKNTENTENIEDLESKREYYEIYYRYEIGKEIYVCLLENGSCTFEAEI